MDLSKIVDDFTLADLQIAKSRASPLFMPRETDTMFILTAHLKGYKRENMKIEISDDGTQIAITGEKPVQETVMIDWKVYKKQIEMRGFRRAFKMPGGVILDKIKARFNEEESVLTISMPKLVKGIRGIRFEEVKEVEVARGSSKSFQISANGVDERETLQPEEYREPNIEDMKERDQAVEKLANASEIVNGREFEELTSEKVEACDLTVHDRGAEILESTKTVPSPPILVEKAHIVVEEQAADEILRVESKIQGQESEKQDTTQGIIEPKEEYKHCQELDQIDALRLKQSTDQEQGNKDQDVQGKQEIQKSENYIEPLGTEEEKSQDDQSIQANLPPEKRSKQCAPMMVGSAILVSIIVLVIHLIRTKKQAREKKH